MTVLWKLLANRDKGYVKASLTTCQPMALVERFGGGPTRATIGCFCGTSTNNPKQAAFFVLDAADPADLLIADDAAIFAAVDTTPKVVRSVTDNKSPDCFLSQNPALNSYAAPN